MSSLKQLAQREMSRKEFLMVLGFGAASILGLSGVIRLLTGKHPHQHIADGYGSTTYGGVTKQLRYTKRA